MSIKSKLRKRTVNALNAGLVPIEYSYDKLKKGIKELKKAAPLVYDEIEHFVTSNIIRMEKKKPFGKGDLAAMGAKITSSLIRKVPSIDEEELKKIVSGRTSQSFLDMVARGLSAGYPEKEYTILPKNKRFKRILITHKRKNNL